MSFCVFSTLFRLGILPIIPSGFRYSTFLFFRFLFLFLHCFQCNFPFVFILSCSEFFRASGLLTISYSRNGVSVPVPGDVPHFGPCILCLIHVPFWDFCCVLFGDVLVGRLNLHLYLTRLRISTYVRCALSLRPVISIVQLVPFLFV